MPKYFYTAKTIDGENKSGFLEAENLHQLANLLRKEGLILIRAELEKKKKFFEFSIPFLSVPLSEKMFFTRNLQVMISAGVPLTRAIFSLKEQSRNKKFKKILESIYQKILKGSKFSDAISEFPNVFSEFYQNMIKVAEEAGNLEQVLNILARQMERENEIKSKVKSAMVYPAVIILAMVGIGILMLVMVVPKLAETFKELEVELPATTKLVIFLGETLAQKWYFLFLGIILILLLFFRIIKTRFGKKIWDRILLKIPVFSGLIKKQNAASVARNLSSLISGGVSLPRALEITANTLGNIFYKEALISAIEKVKKGEKLSHILKKHEKIFPLTLIHMVEVGEETGETSEILTKLADFYENEITTAAESLTSIIEPVLLLIIGIVVGFFAISMVQPMYSMLGEIK